MSETMTKWLSIKTQAAFDADLPAAFSMKFIGLLTKLRRKASTNAQLAETRS